MPLSRSSSSSQAVASQPTSAQERAEVEILKQPKSPSLFSSWFSSDAVERDNPKPHRAVTLNSRPLEASWFD